METFAKPRKLVNNPHYEIERMREIRKLSLDTIDAPIRQIIAEFTDLPYCFTLQSCVGHFVYANGHTIESLDPIPNNDVSLITYRISYFAFCIQNSAQGMRLLSNFSKIPSIDTEYVQFGSPEWFWQRQRNSFALQVMPVRFANKDKAIIDYREALRIQKIRDEFIDHLSDLVQLLRNENILVEK
jgi:hypothetical protein